MELIGFSAVTLDPNTPVLVGVGAVSTPPHLDGSGPAERPEAAELMVSAARLAAVDAVGSAVLESVGLVAAMASTTPYRDPGRLVADALDLPGVHTLVAEPGVLQQHVISHALQAVTRGDVEVALLVAGEAKYRAQQAAFQGIEVTDRVQDESVEPDQRLTADGMVIHRCEIEAGLIQAVHHYAMIENALGAHLGLGRDEQSAQVADCWSRFSQVAVENPLAWTRDSVSAESIGTPGPSNRMLATPYTKLQNSQWNVDQAAALLVTTVGVAAALGISSDRWVFPLGAAESNTMVPLVERAAPARCEGFGVVGAALEEITGLDPGSADYVELYSCFPAAVRIQANELGIGSSRALTVTGGMTFAGGPFNHFVFQALARLIEVLRSDPGSTGLITSVSGMLTKQAAALWSTAAGASPPEFLDVSDRVAAVTALTAVAIGYSGPAEVVTSTVLWNREDAEKAVAIVSTPAASRLVATSTDPDVIARFSMGPLIGEQVEVTATSAASGHATLK
jgi:acetyl-CoA C-acetyltransferase